MRDRLREEVSVGLEVSVENGDELVLLDVVAAHGRLQVASLVAGADQAMAVDDVDPPLAPLGDLASDQLHDGLVLDPEAAEAKDGAIQRLDDEQDDAEARQGLNGGGDVVGSEGEPGEIGRVHPAFDLLRLRQGKEGPLEVPPLPVGHDFDQEGRQGQRQEALDEPEEDLSHGAPPSSVGGSRFTRIPPASDHRHVNFARVLLSGNIIIEDKSTL
ncbi:unnamed protein product [Spirodela intermedia]|uniref:Uncharacterized protein n=1 Tax=Spirodela intermedia TaxID=51605 RepID=A0A7I8IWQ1_SPIIN|nr:unnamed protein product [Spirodela intermedia]CAA6662289.1 unnamed protein product [Spirodela intermedia]